jgi:hypothetical protein
MYATATTAGTAGFLSSQIFSLAVLRFFWQLELSAVLAVTAVEVNQTESYDIKSYNKYWEHRCLSITIKLHFCVL